MALGVVHVIDPLGGGLLGRGGAADAAVLGCAEAIRARQGDGHAVIVIGTAEAARHARRLGLDVHAEVPAPLGHPGLAARGLRRALLRLGGADVIQPWSERARTACRLAALGAGAVAGVPSGLWPVTGPAESVDREAVRAEPGLPGETPTIALLGEPARHADARRFVYMLGLLDVAGQPVSGLVDRRSAHVGRARRFHAEAGVGWRMLIPAEPVCGLVPACELGVLVPPEVASPLSTEERAWVSWSVLRAHLAGVPVVGGCAWLPAEAHPREHAAKLRARSASVTDIARQLSILVGDATLRRRVAEDARESASIFAGRARLGDALGTHWRGVEPMEEGAALSLEG